MNCSKEELLAYLNNELSRPRVQEIARHLESCQACQHQLQRLRQTTELFKKMLKPQALPSDFGLKISQSLATRRRFPQRWHISLALAASILLVLAAFFIIKPSGKPPVLPPAPSAQIKEITLADGSLIVASPHTVFEVSPQESRTLNLHQGELYVKVAPGKRPFKVNTPAGIVTAYGTEFLVNTYKEGGKEMKIRKWIISVLILSGVVGLSNPLGDVVGYQSESLYAQEGSAPKKQVENLALRFAKYYEKVETKVKPQIPAYHLPLKMKAVANPEVLQKLGCAADNPLLKKNGFFVRKWRGDDMVEAYEFLTRCGVPIFITTDSLLHLYHIQFDETLREIEEREFYRDICAISKTMLKRANQAYQSYGAEEADLKEAARRNVAYFTVGLKVLDPTTTIPNYVKQEVQTELANIEKHAGFADSAVFTYKEDYSQYVPRGHYTRSETLKKYFKGLMWYGRLTFIAKGGEPHGSWNQPYLVSEQEAKIQTLAGSMDATYLNEVKLPDGRTCKDAWERIYSVTSFYVGLADDLTPDEYQNGLITALGKNYMIDALKNDENFFKFKVELAKMRGPAIYSGTGESGILYDMWEVLMGKEPKPEELDKLLEKTKGFRFMGQRFIPDSYFMGKMVAPTMGEPKSKGMFTWGMTEAGPARVFPRGLDVMAILGSKRATQILHDLKDDNYKGYYEALEKLQTEIDEVKSGHNWNRNLYWGWLYALRSLLKEDWNGHQTFMTTTAYQDKNLNTVLGSWSQLRHDTILYAKQSYAPAISTGPPRRPKPVQGYVEPVPEFYARLLALNKMTLKGLSEMKVLTNEGTKRLKNLETILARLLKLSEVELQNKELKEVDYEFIRGFGKQIEACVSGVKAKGMKTTLIADVHTDTNTKQVLEEGTGEIELMVVAYKQPDGRIVLGAGPVFSYYEFKHPMSDRLTDEAWREMLKSGKAPARPEWTSSYRQK